MTTKIKPPRKQAELFELVAARPQWEKLPQPIRTELIQFLREMLLSPPARQMMQQIQEGDAHE